jgi:hypothetical protein|tara:strand:- start:17 stop:310 length:294 start_codon:yes stop_codon:yes gene_type:complete
MVSIIKSILAINPNAKVSLDDEDYNKINWLDGTQPISIEQIKSKQLELQAEYDTNQYKYDRAKEYPSIVDQLDDIYHNGIDGWKATIKITKDKYPKE